MYNTDITHAHSPSLFLTSLLFPSTSLFLSLPPLFPLQIPVTREVLSALPTILSALCLNARGLTVFIDADPFDHLFGILISEDYLPAMRRKRGNDQLSELHVIETSTSLCPGHTFHVLFTQYVLASNLCSTCNTHCTCMHGSECSLELLFVHTVCFIMVGSLCELHRIYW